MIECERCHELIDGRTDDNYNIDHTKIQCPFCGHWQEAEWREETMAEYRVVKANSRKELQGAVESLLNEGFKLAPGFAVGFDPNVTSPAGVKTGQEIYYQPMIKEEA